MTDPARIVRLRLRSSSAGLLAVLDAYSFKVKGRDFAHLLVEDPLSAYRVVLEYTRGDRRKAKFLLHNILIALAGSTIEALEAVEALDKGDPGPVERIVRRVASGSAR